MQTISIAIIISKECFYVNLVHSMRMVRFGFRKSWITDEIIKYFGLEKEDTST